MTTPQYMAVYGTLKQDFGNNYLIEEAVLHFIGEGVTVDSKFTLQGGGFPIARDGGNTRVAVEVFSFETEDQIRDIDNLEGHPDWYTRRLVPVHVNGEVLQAWMYIQPPHRHYPPEDLMDSTITVTEDGIAAWQRTA